MKSTQPLGENNIITAHAIHRGRGEDDRNQEDACTAATITLADDHTLHVAMVADGMGGIEGGEIASRIAIDTTLDHLRHGHADQLPGLIEKALLTAHEKVVEKRLELGFDRMGTTATLAAITAENCLYLGHAGDSRAYLIRNRKLHQLTRDHSWGNQQFWAGAMSLTEIQAHDRRDALVRYLGRPEGLEIDLALRLDPYQGDEEAVKNQGLLLLPGDSVMVCSDGLIKMRPNGSGHFVEADEIIAAVTDFLPAEAVEKLLEIALYREADDNISLAVMTLPVSAPYPDERSMPSELVETRPSFATIRDTFTYDRMETVLARPIGDMLPPDIQDGVKDKPEPKVPNRLLLTIAAAILFAAALIVGAVLLFGAHEPPPDQPVVVAAVSGEATVKSRDQEPVPLKPGTDLPALDSHLIVETADGASARLQVPEIGLALTLSGGSTLWLDPPVEESNEQAVKITLAQGSLLVQRGATDAGPVPVYTAMPRVRAVLSGSLLGMQFDETRETFTADCMQGPCEVYGKVGSQPMARCQRSILDTGTTMTTPFDIRGIDWDPVAGSGISDTDLCLGIAPTPVAVIDRFEVNTRQVAYHQQGNLEFTWAAADAVSGIIQDGLSIEIEPTDLNEGTTSIPISSLGVGLHSFTLTVEDSFGAARTSAPVEVEVTAARCTLLDDATLLTLPPEAGQELNPDAEPVEPPDSAEAVLLGRAPDSVPWVQVAYDNLDTLSMTGWLPVDQLDCPDISITRFVVVEP
ncbi:MAG: serine/threonine-protein phosphatase [Anaerolineae bacterium]|nr:serine/threonine-protein phosphatase [Anaerolineae bacterium]